MTLKAEVENMGNAYLRCLRDYNAKAKTMRDATRDYEESERFLDSAADQLIRVAPAETGNRYLKVGGTTLEIKNGWTGKSAIRVLHVEE